jgi:hypothetical protein
MQCYQRQAEEECFVDDLHRLAEQRAHAVNSREERQRGLEDFRRTHAYARMSARKRLSRKLGDIFYRHVLARL